MYSSPPRYSSSQGQPPLYRYPTAPMGAAPSPSAYAAPRYAYPTTPVKDPYKRHARAGSHGVAPTYGYPSPQAQSYYASPYSSGAYYSTYTPSPRQADYVSGPDRRATATRRPSGTEGSKTRIFLNTTSKKSTSSKAKTSRSQYVSSDGVLVDEDEGYYSPGKDQHASGVRGTDHFAFDQGPGYKDVPKSSSSRQRSASYSNHQTSSSSRTKTTKASSKSKPPPPKATAADAARAQIPAGFSYKNWDPAEEPILLLGSVFDANSLGKWIYDWTVYHHGPATPMSDLAGDLWLLLIQLAGKIKRAEECLPRIRHPDDRDLVDDFLRSGDRLWDRFSKILKACEEYMWRAAQKEAKKKGGSSSAAVAMGAKSGCEFVDSIFGRDRKLEETEKLMSGMRLWSMRFDANCEDIMRHPAA